MAYRIQSSSEGLSEDHGKRYKQILSKNQQSNNLSGNGNNRSKYSSPSESDNYNSSSDIVSSKNTKKLQPPNQNIVILKKQIEQLSLQNQTLLSENNSFQSYIQQLTEYINDSNVKYSNNIQKYGISYQKLYLQKAALEESTSEEILSLRNEMQTDREIISSNNNQINKLKQKNQQLIEEIDKEKDLNEILKQKIEELETQLKNNRQLYTNTLFQLETDNKKIKFSNEELANEIKSKNNKIQQLQKQLKKQLGKVQLHEQLPERMVDKQKQIILANNNLINERQKLNNVLKQLDLIKLQLARSEKQRQEYKVKNTKLSVDYKNYFTIQNKQFEDQWKQKQFNYKLEITNLKQRIQKGSRQQRSYQSSLEKIEEKLNMKDRQIESLSKRVKSEIDEKQSYLDEFRKLKENYQDVIRGLEESVEELQHKLWNIGEEKKELEHEVDKFKEVTYQLEYINNQNQKKEGTDYLKEEIEVWGLGDPVRLLRGEEDKKHAERGAKEKQHTFKQKERQSLNKDKGKTTQEDPWSNLTNLIDKMNSL